MISKLIRIDIINSLKRVKMVKRIIKLWKIYLIKKIIREKDILNDNLYEILMIFQRFSLLFIIIQHILCIFL